MDFTGSGGTGGRVKDDTAEVLAMISAGAGSGATGSFDTRVRSAPRGRATDMGMGAPSWQSSGPATPIDEVDWR